MAMSELPDRVKKALDAHIKWRERMAVAQEKVKQSHDWLCTEIATAMKAAKNTDEVKDYGPPPSDDDVPF